MTCPKMSLAWIDDTMSHHNRDMIHILRIIIRQIGRWELFDIFDWFT